MRSPGRLAVGLPTGLPGPSTPVVLVVLVDVAVRAPAGFDRLLFAAAPMSSG
ncbi:hypothetical protein ACIGXI_25945 [Kitasatospora aureofaciens]|uniref:hypothetical protein n=1 Tax=Kitasatospora aureofaciens TaxID=1894 RepID=UPI0037C82248